MYKVLVILLFLCVGAELGAQQVAAYFVSMPDELLLQVEPNRRKDMVDFFQHNQKGGIMNALGGKSEITAMSDKYMAVSLSDVSKMEMRLLTYKDTATVIGVIRTVCAPVCDSRVSFYDGGWNLLDAKSFLQLPVDADFFVSKETPGRDEALKLIDMSLSEYNFAPDDDSFSARYTVKDYLPEEIFKRAAPFLKKEPLRYLWNGKWYEPEN